ncbi:MAG: alkaline phosphatase family protein [Actinomycetota bacterium]|nr:alkaline phosphatase family protein [Actinomycetota bacterium]
MLPAAGLPSARAHRFGLVDVLPNCLDALQGRRGGLDLAPVTHAVVLLVDGLGIAALTPRAGHARTLATRLGIDRPISSVFPTTTAAALATLTTGALPGEHGLVGYTVLDAVNDRVVNQLTGWDAAMTADWQRVPTCFENADAAGLASIAIGPARYRESGFTHAVLRGAEYRSGSSVAERLARAAEALSGPPALIYVYVPELDSASHAHGLESPNWISALEELDAAVGRFVPRLGPTHGLVVSADHGVIDVPHEAQRLVPAELLEGVRHVAGEPRCLQLHLESGESPDAHAERWRSHEGTRAWVTTRTEAIEAGWFGPVAPEVVPRIGDVLVAARKRVAYYADPDDTGRKMIGQHGSLSPDELTIPLLRFGAWATR